MIYVKGNQKKKKKKKKLKMTSDGSPKTQPSIQSSSLTVQFRSHNALFNHTARGYARFTEHVGDDQRTPQKGAHDCATDAGEVPQRYLSRPHHSQNASDTGPPGQLGRVAVIGGSERYVNAIGRFIMKGSE